MVLPSTTADLEVVGLIPVEKAMPGEERRRSRFRRFLPHRHVSDKTLPRPESLREDSISTSPSIQDKEGGFGRPPDANSGTSESGNSGLWGEVYEAFVASEQLPDLRNVARNLRKKSREISSSNLNDPDVEAKASREWRLCKEFQKLAEAKAAELSKGSKGRVTETLQHSYSETLIWVKNFVAVGDVVSQIDPVHVGLPWAGIRTILIVCMRPFSRVWNR